VVSQTKTEVDFVEVSGCVSGMGILKLVHSSLVQRRAYYNSSLGLSWKHIILKIKFPGGEPELSGNFLHLKPQNMA
jgi:hypothetical protein